MLKLVFVLVPVLLSGLTLGPPMTWAAVTYYVSPTSQSCPRKESDPCHSLEEYVANSSEFFSSDKANIVLIFVNGSHTCMSSGGKLAVTDLNNLTMIGESHSVIIHDVKLHMDVKTLQVSSIVFRGGANVHVQEASWVQDLNAVHIVDYKFEERSSLKSIGSNLHLSNCEFLHLSLHSSNNPLTVYDSHVHISGWN